MAFMTFQRKGNREYGFRCHYEREAAGSALKRRLVALGRVVDKE